MDPDSGGGDRAIDVLGLGVTAVDILLRIPSFPEEGSKLIARNATMQGGGLTATALVAASRLGGRARLLGCLGASRFAELAIADLAAEGVDVTGILRRPGAEPFVAVVLVDERTGQRTIVATREGVEYPAPEELPLEDLDRTRCVLVDYLARGSGVALARAARERRIPVVVDVESVNDCTGALLELATDVVVGEAFARVWTGTDDRRKALEVLWSSGDRNSVVITRGARGADWRSREGTFHQEAFGVAAVDTTGCGDVFHGAFALCRARGMPLGQAMTFASAAAALKTRRLGGRAGIPTAEEVEELVGRQKAACAPL